MPIWGIDLGGTKIEGVVLNDDKLPKILVRKRIDTEAARGYQHIIRRINYLLIQWLMNWVIFQRR